MYIPNPFNKGDYYIRNALGQHGKEIILHKFQTMIDGADKMEGSHSNDEMDGLGKIINDDRIIPERIWMRESHFDEIPNIYTYFDSNDLDIVGVRPKSKDLWADFTKKHMERVLQFKPGLFGINYAHIDLRDFQDIEESEMEYISRKEKNPIKTDIEYFSRVLLCKGRVYGNDVPLIRHPSLYIKVAS